MIKANVDIDRNIGVHSALSASSATLYAAKGSLNERSPAKRMRYEELEQKLEESNKRLRNLQTVLAKDMDNNANRPRRIWNLKKTDTPDKQKDPRSKQDTPDRSPASRNQIQDRRNYPPRRYPPVPRRAFSALADETDDPEDPLQDDQADNQDQKDDQDAQAEDAYEQYNDDQH